MKAEHSPAPWSVAGNQGYCVWSGDNIIATMTSPRIRAKVAHADAALMAAAPDLAASLASIIDLAEASLGDFPSRRAECDKARALLESIGYEVRG